MKQILLIAVLTLTFATLCSATQPSPAVSASSTEPNMQAGRLFTVTIRPQAKRIEVEVVGKPVASVQMRDVNVQASIRLGEKQWFLKPLKQKNFFVVQAPAEMPTTDGAQLKLEIRSHGENESFEFRIDTP